MKYRCLVLDHDDTVVNSTAAVHYPPFVAALKALRPGITLSLEDYFLFNFDPGFSAYCDNVLHFTKAEQAWQEENWLRYVADHVPSAYPGMRETLLRFRAEGGLLCVVSHSFRKNILRDYAANGLPTPDLIFGWDEPPEMRKPSPRPLLEILRRFALSPGEAVVVDDLKPGKDMADACGVDFIAAGWAHRIPRIVNYMKASGARYCESVAELDKILFEAS